MKGKGESQRIYWQQWLSSSVGAQGGHTTGSASAQLSQQQHQQQHSRRELITSSAAIRISPDGARAKDVTKLLRGTLNLSSSPSSSNGTINSVDEPQDSLVLVGTLYSLPRDYIQFEHEAQYRLPPQSPSSSSDNANNAGMMRSGYRKQQQQKYDPTVYITSSHSSDPFHVIKTLSPNENPLATRDKMLEHLKKIQDAAPAGRSTISPKVQWYFVPSTSDNSSTRPGASNQSNPIPSCIELDGYCTSMEEEDYDDGESDDEQDADNTYGNPPACQTDAGANDDDDDLAFTRYDDPDLIFSRCSFLKPSPIHPAPLEQASNSSTSNTSDQTEQRRKQARQKEKELRRYVQLSQSQAASSYRCISGYLLKQSHVDPHVWRRVYCVITDDYMWYVTRVPYQKPLSNTKSSSPYTSASPTTHSNSQFRMGKKHGKISLSRALLLEPNTEFSASPLYRIPHAFELVSSRGTTHVFRAPNRSLQRQWIHALSARIMESFENSLMSHAELIVADESIARSNRLASLAVKPLCPKPPPPSSTLENSSDDDNEPINHADTEKQQPITLQQQQQPSPMSFFDLMAKSQNGAIRDERDASHSNQPKVVLSVLGLGLDIADYREQCRHVQATLPARQPVVVLSAEPSKEVTRSTSTSSATSTSSVVDGTTGTMNKKKQQQQQQQKAKMEPLDAEAKKKVRSTWDRASTLLTRSMQIAMQVQQHVNEYNQEKTKKSMDNSHYSSSINSSDQQKQQHHSNHHQLSRSLETLCRHIDYVITGQHRPISSTISQQQKTSATTTTMTTTSSTHTRTNDMTNGYKMKNNNTKNSINSRSKNTNNNSGNTIKGTTSTKSRHDEYDPPPMDLFDLLLAELQTLVISSTAD